MLVKKRPIVRRRFDLRRLRSIDCAQVRRSDERVIDAVRARLKWRVKNFRRWLVGIAGGKTDTKQLFYPAQLFRRERRLLQQKTRSEREAIRSGSLKRLRAGWDTISMKVRRRVCDTAGCQDFARRGEQARNLLFRAREVDYAVRREVVEIILERLARQHIIFRERESA